MKIRLMNKAEQQALKSVYDRGPIVVGGKKISYVAFRRMAYYSTLNGCFMVQWQGMTLGIEKDGYVHS